MLWRKAVFILLIALVLSPLGSPPLALATGLALALTIQTPFPHLSGRPTKILLQASVVLLGFGMDLGSVLAAGRRGIGFTVATILGTLGAGYLIGKALSVRPKTSALISGGTAICGGSAIAAIGPAIDADPEEMSVALGTVFLLNSVALFLFPLTGTALGLSQEQFGVWSAIAIHDTSSVVGAAGAYGADALAIATVVKLARAIWIAPLALVAGAIYSRRSGQGSGRVAIPWFILLFLAASGIRTLFWGAVFPSIFDALVNLARTGMVLTLFLIGAGLSRQVVRQVGIRPLLQGLVLWAIISVVSLAAILNLV